LALIPGAPAPWPTIRVAPGHFGAVGQAYHEVDPILAKPDGARGGGPTAAELLGLHNRALCEFDSGDVGRESQVILDS
jgi:hypothetical protein